jgi:hypothetical protein
MVLYASSCVPLYAVHSNSRVERLQQSGGMLDPNDIPWIDEKGGAEGGFPFDPPSTLTHHGIIDAITLLRAELMHWHPVKFHARFGGRIAVAGVDAGTGSGTTAGAVRKRVADIAAGINEKIASLQTQIDDGRLA